MGYVGWLPGSVETQRGYLGILGLQHITWEAPSKPQSIQLKTMRKVFLPIFLKT